MFIPWGRWSNLTTVQYFSNGLVQPPPSYELGPSSTMPSSRRFHLGLGHWFWSFSRESFGIARGVQKGKVGHRFWYDQGLFQHVFFCFVFFFKCWNYPLIYWSKQKKLRVIFWDILILPLMRTISCVTLNFGFMNCWEILGYKLLGCQCQSSD